MWSVFISMKIGIGSMYIIYFFCSEQRERERIGCYRNGDVGAVLVEEEEVVVVVVAVSLLPTIALFFRVSSLTMLESLLESLLGASSARLLCDINSCTT
ncbi:hypothetical protein BDF14DRAFT_1273377 [Spinellus fusiger]|nr:hypothetical protein BDF14DRAFT_1273377 [Spinellus fusiger]